VPLLPVSIIYLGDLFIKWHWLFGKKKISLDSRAILS
jgi:hypothetical protein